LQERVPVQYLTGVAHWRHFSLKVTPAVLIPRPETELLVDLAVGAVKERSSAATANPKSTPPNPPLPRGGEDLNPSKLRGGEDLNPSELWRGEDLNPSELRRGEDLNPSEFWRGEDLNPSKLRRGEVARSNWVDLGTGSGAIAIGLAEALTNAVIYAVDCSSEALAVARQNAENLGFANRVNFYQGSWWEPLRFLKGRVSGMVSNPPYIPSSTVLTLEPEVFKHEPHLALDGGLDGLECIRHLANTAPDYLESGGVWLVEMMAGQAEAVADMLESHGSYCKVQIFPDLAGVDRFALAYRL